MVYAESIASLSGGVLYKRDTSNRKDWRRWEYKKIKFILHYIYLLKA